MGRPLLFAAAAIVGAAGACHTERATENASAKGDCPPAWLAPPAVDAAITPPGGGGPVVFHAQAVGSQNYVCTRITSDAGAAYAWTFTGPEATLNDCRGEPVGRHLASEGGPTAPEWRLYAGGAIVGHKLAASTPASAVGSVPWLLLAVDRRDGAGPLSGARFVERVSTRGGAAPAAACDEAHAGVVEKSAYTGDYYFLGP